MGSNAHLFTEGAGVGSPHSLENCGSARMMVRCLHPPPFSLQEIILNYSVDMLKKSAFQDELTNILELLPVEQVDQETLNVIEYLKRRIKEIDKQTK